MRVAWCLYKNPGGIYGLTAIDPFDIESSNLVGQVLRAGQMRAGTYEAGGRYVWAGYIKIPPRHQVFNEQDALVIAFNAGANSQACGLCSYLESS
jgi:hypothetical protein